VVDRNVVEQQHNFHRVMGPGARTQDGDLNRVNGFAAFNRRIASPRLSPPFGRRGSGSGPSSSRRSRANGGGSATEGESLRVTVDIRPCANCLLQRTSRGSGFATAVVPAATGIVGCVVIIAGLLFAWLLWEGIHFIRYTRVLH
jgi:hypothetical protein